MTRQGIRGLGLAAGLALAARLLAWAAPAPALLLATLRHPQQAAVDVGVDALALAAASAACWLALGWLGIALLACAAERLPGHGGDIASRLAAATVPPTARRIVALALGLTVVTAAGAAPAMAGAVQPPPATRTLDLDWPMAGPPVPAGHPLVRQPTAARPNSSREHPEVTVRPGDSLWSIAAGHLDSGVSEARIAATWPRWYQANRFVVGADPNLLLPGQRLLPPDDTSGDQP